jgi:hypothetical protein
MLAVGAPQPSCPAAVQFSTAESWDARPFLETIVRTCSLADPSVQSILIERFERQNANPKWFDWEEDTDFELYDSRLGEIIQEIAADYHVPEAFRALVRANYSEDSPFAVWLLKTHGDEILPWLFEAARTSDVRVEERAIVTLGELVNACKSGAENCKQVASQSHQILALLRAKSHDKDFNVRSNAIGALGFCGERQDLALLDQLATEFVRRYAGSDWTSEQNKKSSLWVIDQARSRIEARLR